MSAESRDPSVPASFEVLGEHYRLVEKLGEGAFGVVYRAHHELLNEDFAVKILKPELCEDNSVRERFLDEARALIRFSHPNVVQVRHVGEHEGRLYLVMDLVRGEMLNDLLRRKGALPEARAVDLELQLLAGLEAAHAAKIVHRDLKPGNLILDRDPDGQDRLRVLDFGLSKLSGDGVANAQRSVTGAIIGTLAYMSPEQLAGERDIDARSDVFAAGLILHEMLAGKHPYPGESGIVVAAKLLREPVPDLEPKKAAKLQDHVKAALKEALERDRDARFRTAFAFAQALEGKGPPTDTSRVTTIQQARAELARAEAREAAERRAKRGGTRRSAWIAGVVVVVAAVAAFFALKQGDGDRSGDGDGNSHGSGTPVATKTPAGEPGTSPDTPTAPVPAPPAEPDPEPVPVPSPTPSTPEPEEPGAGETPSSPAPWPATPPESNGPEPAAPTPPDPTPPEPATPEPETPEPETPESGAAEPTPADPVAPEPAAVDPAPAEPVTPAPETPEPAPETPTPPEPATPEPPVAPAATDTPSTGDAREAALSKTRAGAWGEARMLWAGILQQDALDVEALRGTAMTWLHESDALARRGRPAEALRSLDGLVEWLTRMYRSQYEPRSASDRQGMMHPMGFTLMHRGEAQTERARWLRVQGNAAAANAALEAAQVDLEFSDQYLYRDGENGWDLLLRWAELRRTRGDYAASLEDLALTTRVDSDLVPARMWVAHFVGLRRAAERALAAPDGRQAELALKTAQEALQIAKKGESWTRTRGEGFNRPEWLEAARVVVVREMAAPADEDRTALRGLLAWYLDQAKAQPAPPWESEALATSRLRSVEAALAVMDARIAARRSADAKARGRTADAETYQAEAQERSGEALRLAKEAVDLREQVAKAGERLPSPCSHLMLAYVLRAQGRGTEAEPVLARAVDAARRNPPSGPLPCMVCEPASR